MPTENTDESGPIHAGKKVLVLGLEKSGKTCLLAAMANEEMKKEYQPTLGFNVVCITNIEHRLDMMEIGGSGRYKDYWSKFAKDTNMLLFVIDSSDKESLHHALDALKEILVIDDLEQVPVVIVFSKRDNLSAMPIDDIVARVNNEQFHGKNFQYASVQTQCGGAPKTEGVAELQDTLLNLC